MKTKKQFKKDIKEQGFCVFNEGVTDTFIRRYACDKGEAVSDFKVEVGEKEFVLEDNKKAYEIICNLDRRYGTL